MSDITNADEIVGLALVPIGCRPGFRKAGNDWQIAFFNVGLFDFYFDDQLIEVLIRPEVINRFEFIFSIDTGYGDEVIELSFVAVAQKAHG